MRAARGPRVLLATLPLRQVPLDLQETQVQRDKLGRQVPPVPPVVQVPQDLQEIPVPLDCKVLLELLLTRVRQATQVPLEGQVLQVFVALQVSQALLDIRVRREWLALPQVLAQQGTQVPLAGQVLLDLQDLQVQRVQRALQV